MGLRRALPWAIALASLLPKAAAASGPEPLEAILRRILDRPDTASWMRLRALELREQTADVGLEIPAHIPLTALPAVVDLRFELAVGAITAARPLVRRIDLLVAHPGKPLAPPPRSTPPTSPPPPRRAVRGAPGRFPHGQRLAGRTVALSPGHGYIWYDNLDRYSTQRSRIQWEGCGECRGIVEDFETHEIVVRELVPLLEGAGATVVLVRERDYAAHLALADDGGPDYTELAGVFADGTSAGGHGAGYRTSSSTNAVIAWDLTAARSGPQLLSTWFVAGQNRNDGAVLTVRTPGGPHTHRIDLTTHGRRWTPIGLLGLRQGDPISVEMRAPATADGTEFLIGDAMRLGAGTHDSDHPWWQMGANPFAKHQAAPAAITARGDVTIRPRYAEWYGADVYLSVHSNASGQARSTAAGTSTYRFSCRSFPDHSADPDPAQCDDPAGSDRLQALVHDAVVTKLRNDWDPQWRDRGTRVANFGELRELDVIPGALIETGFHDNVRLADGSPLRVTDNQALHDPRWRRAVAFGLYQGLSEFLVGAGPLLLEPPAGLIAKRVSEDRATVDFEAVDGAAGYRVYVATGGPSFDAGRIIDSPPAQIEGLTPEAAVLFRVATLNAAGEGRSSPIVATRPSARRAQILIVDGFEREDAWVDHRDNRGDTALIHGLALANTGVVFDTASERALRSGAVAIEGYDGLVIALGRESTEHQVLTADLRQAITRWSAAGGAVFAAGSEIAWALDTRGDDESRAFLAAVFGAAADRDDAAATALRAEPGSWIAVAGGPFALDDGTGGGLEAKSSDVLGPLAGAAVELRYGDGDDVAAVRLGKNVAAGFALDSVVGEAARGALLSAWVAEAIEPPEVPQTDAGVVPPPPDAAIIDAADPAPDAAVVSADASQSGLRQRHYGRPAIRGGCSCTSQHRSGDYPQAWLLIALATGLRRRRARRCQPRPSTTRRTRLDHHGGRRS